MQRIIDYPVRGTMARQLDIAVTSYWSKFRRAEHSEIPVAKTQVFEKRYFESS